MLNTRLHVGKDLIKSLDIHLDNKEVIVLALHRDSLETAQMISKKFSVPMDLHVVRDINLPFLPEVVMGAVDDEGGFVVNPETAPFVDSVLFHSERLRELRGAYLENKNLRQKKLKLDYTDKTVILVADTLRSEDKVFATINWLKDKKISQIILVASVISNSALQELEGELDIIIVEETLDVVTQAKDHFIHYPTLKEENIKKILTDY